MSAIISTLIASCLSAFYLFYSWEILKVKNLQPSKYNRVLFFFILVLILSINYLYINRFFGLMILIMILTMLNMLMYRHSLKTAL